MKSKFLLTLLTCACASLARADFNPIALTPSSYTLSIVVPASTVKALPECINVTAGSGVSKGDNTFFEQGLYQRGTPGPALGIPPHNTVFTSVSNANMTFLMPPDYTVANELMVDASFPTGTLTFTTPTTATNLAVLCTSGGGASTVHYIVTHADTSTETGTLSLLDWFAGGPTIAWGANGRVSNGGGLNNINTGAATNNQPPFLYANQITVSGASPVVSVEFDTPSGNHPNFFAISGNASGAAWTPIPLATSSYNVIGIVPAAVPFPVTGTMDRGTNINSANGMFTWFEQGYDRAVPSAGLPPANTPFNSIAQPTHHYQFASYTGNNALLIDTNHQLGNITPATPDSYTGIAFLTAGGNEGSPNIMSNICVIQHLDGVNETNTFLAFDWFDNSHNGALAFQSNGRVNMNARAFGNIGGIPPNPNLFETFFLLTDTTSPVTNIVVKYNLAPNAVCTTFVMGVSATKDGVPAIVTSGPNPGSQALPPGTNATFTVGLSGTPPLGGFWQVDYGLGAGFQALTDGVDVNGSTIIGSQTLSLTISNLFVADSATYQFVAGNNFGTNTSPTATLTVSPEVPTISPANPSVFTGNNVPLTANVTAGPALQYQWFVIDNSSVSNVIANATNSTYVIPNVNVSQSGFTYGVTVWNIYGTNSATTSLTVSDSAAFLAGDLSPTNSEAFAGAQVTYAVNASGNTPIFYQWKTNGVVVSGVNSNRLTLSTPCGPTTVQVSFSNSLSGGVMVNSTIVQLQGDGNPLNLGFNTSGTGWQTNGTLAGITNNTLLLTDGAGGEASSAFYTIAQYVGGAWNASYIYNSHGGGADGVAFILQTTNPAALGGGGGQLGYTGIGGSSLAYEINIYNGQTIGGTLASNGASGTYQSVAPVDVTTTNDILVNLAWANGVLTATLTDQKTFATFTTNYNVGPLPALLGGNLAYIGFSGADGGVAAVQTVRNLQFHSVLPAVKLALAPGTGSAFAITWPSADPAYVLQTNSSLQNPSGWAATPAPVNANGTNTFNVNPASGSPQLFYRLLRNACP